MLNYITRKIDLAPDVITELTKAEQTITFSSSFQWRSPNTVKQFKLVSGYVSKAIPNIFSVGDFTNRIIRTTKDNWATHDDIQLDIGSYTVSTISKAINETIGTDYYTDASDPAFTMYSNTTLEKVYIVIDNSKMISGTFGIDFGQSMIYELLGFVDTKIFTGSGISTASDFAQLDYYGNVLKIYLDGLGPLSIENNKSSNLVATIDMNSADGKNVYSVDTTGYNTPITLTGVPSELYAYTIRLIGSREDRPIYISQGEIYLSFLLIEPM